MIVASINGHRVDVEIVEPDGGEGADIGEDERAAIAALDRALRNDRRFREAYPGARLERVDSNQVLGDDDEGRFYLRYAFQGGDTEFWGCRGDATRIDLERGTIRLAT